MTSRKIVLVGHGYVGLVFIVAGRGVSHWRTTPNIRPSVVLTVIKSGREGFRFSRTADALKTMGNRFNRRTSPLGNPYRDWFVDNVACPFCGADVGQRCWTRRAQSEYGLQFPTTTHDSRKNVAKALYLLDTAPRERYWEILDLATA